MMPRKLFRDVGLGSNRMIITKMRNQLRQAGRQEGLPKCHYQGVVDVVKLDIVLSSVVCDTTYFFSISLRLVV
jgi:hypothetical protein